MHDLHVIQGPNVTRDVREKIAFFAFHAFVVEDSRFQQNRVRAKLYNCGACVCKGNVEIRILRKKCAINISLRTSIHLDILTAKFIPSIQYSTGI